MKYQYYDYIKPLDGDRQIRIYIESAVYDLTNTEIIDLLEKVLSAYKNARDNSKATVLNENIELEDDDEMD